jgi:hypothetical protein
MSNKQYTASISLSARSNVSAGLKIDIRFDRVLVQSMILTDQAQHWSWLFDDTPADHVLEIELSNKLPHHTVLDHKGQIIEDVLAEIYDIKLSDIDFTSVFYEQSVYTHDSNGWSNPVTTQFFHSLGCNGKVRFLFSTPAYAWLIENTQ